MVSTRSEEWFGYLAERFQSCRLAPLLTVCPQSAKKQWLIERIGSGDSVALCSHAVARRSDKSGGQFHMAFP